MKNCYVKNCNTNICKTVCLFWIRKKNQWIFSILQCRHDLRKWPLRRKASTKKMMSISGNYLLTFVCCGCDLVWVSKCVCVYMWGCLCAVIELLSKGKMNIPLVDISLGQSSNPFDPRKYWIFGRISRLDFAWKYYVSLKIIYLNKVS